MTPPRPTITAHFKGGGPLDGTTDTYTVMIGDEAPEVIIYVHRREYRYKRRQQRPDGAWDYTYLFPRR